MKALRSILFCRVSRLLLLFFFLSLLGSLTFSSIVQAQLIVYRYDETTSTNGKGRLTSVTDPTGSTNFKYDQRGNITETNKTIDGFCYKMTRTYDSLNRVTSLKYPESSVNCGTNGEVVNYTYDTAGNLKTVGSYVPDIQYNALGQRTSMNLGSGCVFQSKVSTDSDGKLATDSNPRWPPIPVQIGQ